MMNPFEEIVNKSADKNDSEVEERVLYVISIHLLILGIWIDRYR